jgi:chromosome segregation ATPase
MNAEHQKQIDAAVKTISEKLPDLIKVKEQLEELSTEMSEKLDNTPDNLRGSDAFAEREATRDALDEALSEYGDALDNVQTAVDSLENMS